MNGIPGPTIPWFELTVLALYVWLPHPIDYAVVGLIALICAVSKLRWLKKRRGYRLHALSALQAEEWARTQLGMAPKT